MEGGAGRAGERSCDLCFLVCWKMLACRYMLNSLVLMLLSDGAALICFPSDNKKPLTVAECMILSTFTNQTSTAGWFGD